MDMIETALDSSGDKEGECEDDKVALTRRLGIVEDHHSRDSASPILAEGGFALRPEAEHAGTLAYRVVQFSGDGVEASLPQGSGGGVPTLLTTQQVNGSPSDSETRLALITSPGDSQTDGTQAVVVSGGQFYIVSDASNVLSPTGTQRSLAPRTSDQVITPRLGGNTREEKRRVTHNEVERRRRDKINTWITRLAKIIPDCPESHSKNSQSKGGILAKACDHIHDLRIQNEQLQERLKDHQRREMDYDILKQEVDVLKNENAALKNENALMRSQLQQQGLMGDLPT
ncbi:unnamed protein product, partial [Meganyctiphanes norvegica]